MDKKRQCTVAWLIALASICIPLISHASALPPACAVEFVSYGQGTPVTPAEVTGVPGQRVALNATHPDIGTTDQGGLRSKSMPYLIPGNNVDLVTICGKYAFVRFQGLKHSTSGWIDSARIKITGATHVLPSVSKDETCKAYADKVNGGGIVGPIVERRLDGSYIKNKLISGEYGFYDGSASRLNINGRVVTATKMGTMNSCESSLIQVWPKDLINGTTPSDHPTSHPDNREGFIFSEYLIDVLGQPMIEGLGVNANKVYLMSIDAKGNITPICEGNLKARQNNEVSNIYQGAVCKALLSGRATSIAMDEPSSDESIVGAKVADRSLGNRSAIVDVARLTANVDSILGKATFSLTQTGVADLDNSGHEHTIGLVTYIRTSDRCDQEAHIEIPVFLDKRGVADPNAASNGATFNALGRPDNLGEPRGNLYTHLVRYAGRVYVETSNVMNSSFDEAWSIDKSGVHPICSFNAYFYDVKPAI